MFKININNFRSFKNQDIDLSRINILIGENSGGKSSLLKFLLALKQTIDNPNISNLILSSDDVDLGTYNEVVYNHIEKERISFSFSFKEELEEYIKYFLFNVIESNKKILGHLKKPLQKETIVTYSLNKELDIHHSILTTFSNDYLGELQIIFDQEEEEKEQYEIFGEKPKCILQYKNKSRNKEFIFENIEYEKKGFLTIIEASSLRSVCLKKYNNEILFYEMSVFLLNQNLIEYYIQNLRYLNPLSSKPERVYLNKDSQKHYRKANLENFTNQITNGQISKKEIKKFNNILKKYGIAEDFNIISSKNLPVSEIKISIKDLTSNIMDVGYGVALQIPLLFEAFLSEQQHGTTFLIEQPEVHLHPKLQAKFIETLLSLGEKNSYIIETHSEYIVRMLQIIVKNKKFNVSNNDVRVYYFQRDDNKFNVSYHHIDKNGKMIKEFPSGFFDNSYSLTKSLMF